MTDRPLPAAVEIERQVLACLLVYPDTWTVAREWITGPEAFHDSMHRSIYAQAEAIAREVPDADGTYISAALSDSGHEDAADAVTRILATWTSETQIETLLADLRAYQERRAIMQTCMDGWARAGEDDPGTLRDELVAKLQDIEATGLVRVPDMAHVAGRLMAHVQMQRQSPTAGISWGLDGLDDALLQPGSYSVIAARPGQGKTAFASPP